MVIEKLENRERHTHTKRDGCSSVGRVAQSRPVGHGFNHYILQ